MTCEETIQSLFDHFPTLFKDRSDALNHLFCVIGNGYRWENGALVSDQDMPPVNPLKDGKAFQYNLLSLRETARQLVGNKRDESYFLSIPDDKYHRHPRKERWYFYHGGVDNCRPYALMFQRPENINPDWNEALTECIALLREDGYQI